MFVLVFNGEFQCDYPNEFLEDLDKLREKHKVDYFGKIITKDLGKYVDFQKQEDTVVEEDRHAEES